MRYSWRQLTDRHEQRTRFPLIEDAVLYIRSLPPSDRLIAYVLTGLAGLSVLVGLFALQRSFLIEEPAYGGSFTEGLVGTPRFINPLLALTDTDRDLARLTYAGLMGTSGDGTLVPVLAESYTVADTGLVYTFTLRADAQFHDGTPVTAEDVVFTVQKAQDPGLKSPELANWSGIRAEAVDSRTVRFTLPRAYAPFLEKTTLGILPSSLWRDVSNSQFPFSPLMVRPVGAGPFKVENVRQNKEGFITGYTLSAFGEYALGRPYLDRISFAFFDEEDALSFALRNGRIDSAYGVAREGALEAPYARVFGTFFNENANPVFADADVRRALSLAINREAITNVILGGYATPIAGPVPPGSGIELTPIPTAENRIRAAADILEEAGWTYDDEARLWDNPDVEAELRVTLRTSNVPELKTIGQQIQADWAALGVPTSLELFEPSDLTQNVIRPRNYDALLFGMIVGRDRDLYAFWHTQERSDPGLNIALYSNTEVDALLERLRTQSDPAVRSEALQAIETAIASDYPAAFTHAPTFVYAAPRGMKGIELPQIGAPSDRFATAASWYRNTQEVWPIFAKRQ
ncbi:MAG TPA: peptide ABC transporter substrate-binding protein [Candidatus Paceibacterota bacterium]|nr:peptide ABC transporter substrate-binding protein [Candidatus Paceibacterota bacterium]